MRRVSGVAFLLVCLVMVTGAASGCGGDAEPAISSINPSSGPPLTEMLVSGSGFGEGGAGSRVELDGEAIAHRSWSDGEIVATIPGDVEAGNYAVTVVTDKASSGGIGFEVIEDDPSPAPSPAPSPPEAETQKDVIIAYCDANDMWHPVPEVKQGQIAGIELVQTSGVDPDWELWVRPIGEGDDLYFFLLRKTDGQWTVVKCDLRSASWATETPQQYGAPEDISIPPEPWWPE